MAATTGPLHESWQSVSVEIEPDRPASIAVKGMEMIHTPAGSFIMGSEDGGANEKPPHELHLDGF